MKRFVFSILAVAVFFVGLGSLAEQVGAKFKSDEKALEIVRKARTAIGGEAAIAQVRSMVISGRTTHNFKFDGAERSEQGETEIAFQFPDKMMTVVKMGKDDGTGARIVQQQHDVILMQHADGEMKVREPINEIRTADGQKIIVREMLPPDAPATAGDGNKVIVRKLEGGERGTFKVRTAGEGNPEEVKDIVIVRGEHDAARHAPVKRNELLRVALSLLLTAPEGMDVNYTFAGETDVDGTACNIINAEFGGVSYKLYIGKANNLPVAMSYAGMEMPRMVKFTKELPAGAPAPDAARDAVQFRTKVDLDATPVENFVRFSDYRSVGGVQLPYRWTTSVAGSVKETFDVTTFDVNPANIAEKFQNQKVMVRTKKPDGQ